MELSIKQLYCNVMSLVKLKFPNWTFEIVLNIMFILNLLPDIEDVSIISEFMLLTDCFVIAFAHKAIHLESWLGTISFHRLHSARWLDEANINCNQLVFQIIFGGSWLNQKRLLLPVQWWDWWRSVRVSMSLALLLLLLSALLPSPSLADGDGR